MLSDLKWGNTGNKEGKEQIDHVIQDTEGVVGKPADKFITYFIPERKNKEEEWHANSNTVC